MKFLEIANNTQITYFVYFPFLINKYNKINKNKIKI